MRLRGLLCLTIVSTLLLGVVVPLATPASAASVVVLSRVRVCLGSGTVDVNPGVLRIPFGSNNDGNFTFNQVVLVCAGVHANVTVNSTVTPFAGPEMTGVGSVSSSGAFGVGNCGGVDVPVMMSVCGNYNSTGFLVGPGCAGTLGGDEAGNTNPANVLASDWSVLMGGLIMGGVTCNTMAEPTGNVANAEVGVVAMVGVPNPLATDGQVAGNDPYPGECAAPPPTPQDPNIAAIWFCQIIVAGVIVMTAADIDVVAP